MLDDTLVLAFFEGERYVARVDIGPHETPHFVESVLTAVDFMGIDVARAVRSARETARRLGEAKAAGVDVDQILPEVHKYPKETAH